MSTNEGPGKLRINDKVYEIPSDYRIREYRMLEQMTGKDAISEIDFTSSKAISAVALILLQRENPEFTEADLDDVMVGFAEGDDGPPAKKPRRSGAQS